MTRLTGRLVKLTWGGKLFNGESWSCSLHMMSSAQQPFTIPAASFKLPIGDWMSRATSKLNPYAVLEFIKANEVHKTTVVGVHKAGQYVSQGDPNNVVVSPALAGMGAYASPGQLSVAVTTRTGITRGRGSHGRFYPPSSVLQVEADGRLSGVDPLGIANSAQELLSELNAAARVGVSAGDEYLCSVWSQVGGFGETINRVSCGKVVDTQRRRRAQLNEENIFAVAAV